MPDRTRLTDKVTVGGQPTVDDLRALRAEGFVTVVNLRTAMVQPYATRPTVPELATT